MPDVEKSERERREAALKCWFLTGATCSGKTNAAVVLAERADAEIISLDSMAIYRGMDLGTAKPPAAVRQRVPHHLIDIRDPHEEFSVSQYCELAHEAIEQIHGRGKRVLFVGGTPLYLKSLLRGLFRGPAADWEFRESIETELRELNIGELRKRLQQVDPLSAHKLHPNDKRRMIRALEVYHLTGEPISHQQTQFEEGTAAEDCNVFVMKWPREKLHERINRRVNEMFEKGFENEVRGLLERYGQLSHTAAQAVGYAEVIALIQRRSDLETTIETVKTRTRRFARRQETWFRGLSECRWINVDESTDQDQMIEQLIEMAYATERRMCEKWVAE